jgi:hypothetical protein
MRKVLKRDGVSDGYDTGIVVKYFYLISGVAKWMKKPEHDGWLHGISMGVTQAV